MPGINLHIHTTSSDGMFTPDEIIALSIKVGNDIISITDHSTAAAYQDLNVPIGIEVVPGIELECNYASKTMHILGYYFNISKLNNKLSELSGSSNERTLIILTKLKSNGIEFDDEFITNLLTLDKGVRKLIAEQLISDGHAKDMRHAFIKYLGLPGVAYALPTDSPDDVINAIISSGGVPVFAHPHKFFRDCHYSNILKEINKLKELGLMGIESYCADSTIDNIDCFQNISTELGLISTGGSDFHKDTDPLLYNFPNSRECIKALRDLAAF